MRVRLALSLLVLAPLGCAEQAPAPPSSPPAPPSKADDPGFRVGGVRSVYLVGNDLTPGHDRIEVTVDAAASIEFVDLWIDRQFVARAFAADSSPAPGFAARVELSAPVTDLAPGEHEVLLAADGAAFAFAQRFFTRTHPLYVVVSNDWDRPDNADAMLERQERLHARHPHLLLTHFVGPYTFTDPALPGSRAAFLVDWLNDLRETEGDEIGLHIHPYCHFVESAGVPCRTERSFARATGDATGYTIYLGSYTEDEFTTLLQESIALFEDNGLGRPTSFRAGGWTLEAHTNRALERAGFVADTSASNWRRMEEWEDNPGATLFQWNRDNWGPIDETSQPYYPSRTDLLSTAAPRSAVLQVPDNGLLVDYVTGAEMIDMFEVNCAGGVLDAPRAYSIGYHPPNFSELFFSRMDQALTHIDQHLAAEDRGPVVYARLSDLVLVWPR